jgi:hypothetical protein
LLLEQTDLEASLKSRYQDSLRCQLRTPPDITRKERDTIEALWQCANGENPRMMYLFGFCLELGFGVEHNPAQAVELYIRSSRVGVHEAQYRLSLCLRDGVGIPRDLHWTVAVLQAAANAGDRDAQYDYTACLECGIGCVRDHAASCTFLERAALAGHVNAAILILAMKQEFSQTTRECCAAWALPSEQEQPILEHRSPLTDHRTLESTQSNSFALRSYWTGWTRFLRFPHFQ